MDVTQIVIALLTLFGALGSAYYGAKKAGDVAEAKQDAKIEESRLIEQIHHEQVTEAIERLEKKQDKHNAVIERTYDLEKRVTVLEERHG